MNKKGMQKGTVKRLITYVTKKYTKRVNEYLFLPYLESIFEPNNDDDNFEYFLKRIFPVIKVAAGNSPSEMEDDYKTRPSEFVYRFIQRKLGMGSPELYNIPIDDAFVEETYCVITNDEFGKGWDVTYTIEEGRDYVQSIGEDPDTVEESGWDIKIDVNDILNEKDLYPDIYNYITNHDGELYQNYLKVREFYEELKKNKESKPKGFKKLFS